MIPDRNMASNISRRLPKGEFTDLYNEGKKRGRSQGFIFGVIITMTLNFCVYYLFP